MNNPYYVKILLIMQAMVHCLNGAIYISRDQSGWINISHDG